MVSLKIRPTSGRQHWGLHRASGRPDRPDRYTGWDEQCHWGGLGRPGM